MQREVENDWRHIIRRSINYGRQLKDQFDDALDKSGDTFSGLLNELRKKVTPDYSDSEDEHSDIRDELDGYRHTIAGIAAREELTENELEILDKINKELDEIYYDVYRNSVESKLGYEARIMKLAGDIEMLRNAISVRKQREAEDKIKAATQNRRSQAQQARRKREREEREKREQEERQRREAKEEEQWQEEQRYREENERKRREEEKKRQEKRRRERNQRTSSSAGNTGGSVKDDSRVAGVETKYFKGCESIDDLSLRYKKLCLIYHPDSGSGDVDTYIELKDEYEMLKKRLS
jgi:Mg-chelatase subunit ChlI